MDTTSNDKFTSNSQQKRHKVSIKRTIKYNIPKAHGLFGLKKNWKPTLFLVGISLIVRFLTHSGTPSASKEPGSFPHDNEPFVPLIKEKYDESALFEYHPAPPPVSNPGTHGDLGAAVVVPEELKEEAKRRYKENEFDVIANELMPTNRSLSDYRYPECAALQYPKKLPQVSVIIVYHNEAWSTLTRTVWSVITQSPRELLKEIILVDDFSSRGFGDRDLHDYMSKVPVPVILEKTPERVGLIQARLLGASRASAQVMVFLDAHCECIRYWLEPLLAPIVERRTTVTTPVIDVIDFDTMALRTAGINTRGSFDLGLSFTWDLIPPKYLKTLTENRTAPIMAPAMAGGLFAIDREYFYKLGAYDPKMKIWGGENLEMSVRIWSCGGRLITIPCSRVGHIFRKESPYDLPGGATHIVGHNLARMVDVWFDDYKKYYYVINPHSLKERTNVTDRLILRKQLKCKSFKWYLENVFPESPYNIKNARLGEIESLNSENKCLDSMGPSRQENREMKLKNCHREGGNQIFMLTDKNEIREKKFCLDAVKEGGPIKTFNCHGEQGNQKWIYHEDRNEFEHNTGKCLTSHENSDKVTLEECEDYDDQKWFFRERIFKD